MSDGMGREPAYLSSHATNRYFIPNWGTYYDFLDDNRFSLALGVTPNKSCYTNYEKKFAVCNLDLKYTYNVQFKNGWALPLSAEYIYNPAFDKSYVNFAANFAF